eukprot:Seg2468.2 transcript_id=Seg2468.2/GoldUCD/mRNA.D3Y31 product="hypothetical protein" protein_id=Seg2468.2/GoldUCD/D3Y31
MAKFGCMPQEVLEKILKCLPLQDQINSGFVCARWNEVIVRNLKSVTINPSVPFGGRWVEENLRWIDYGSRYVEKKVDSEFYFERYTRERSQDGEARYRDENDPADQEMKKLIPKLCKLTNKLETLNIENYHLDTESLTELLSSQRAIINLRIKQDLLPASVKNVYFEKIAEVIIRHRETLEVIELRIRSNSPVLEMFTDTITYIGDIIDDCKGGLSFPRLKSLTLKGEACNGIRVLSNILFKSFMETSQLEELDLDLKFSVKIEHEIRSWDLHLLRKCSLWDFHEIAEDLIMHCLNITHLVGFHSYRYPLLYAKDMHNIISTYGPQLKSLECCVVKMETVNAIVEKCKNLESLKLHFEGYPDDESWGWIDESVAIKNSVPLFGCLEKLTEIGLWLRRSYMQFKAEIACELLEICGMNLQSLTLLFYGCESHKIMNAIGANCKNLKKLELFIYEELEDTERGTTEEISRARQLQEGVEVMLEGCQNLQSLYLRVSLDDEKCPWNDAIILEKISKNQRQLESLTIFQPWRYPKENFVKLTHALPFCNIESIIVEPGDVC